MENTTKIRGNAKMVAHRGLSGIERENTASAFIAAANRSYYGIETDIHRTADGKYILIHDSQTGRVAGTDLNVEESTFDQLRALTLLDRNGETGRGDLMLPTLEEYIGICKKYGKAAVLELKTSMEAPWIYEIMEQIEQMDYSKETVIISFHLENLVALREKYPNQAAQYLVSKIPDPEELVATLRQYHLDLDAHFKSVTPEILNRMHQNGILVNVWTVDDPMDGERMSAMGVDFITSNILE